MCNMSCSYDSDEEYRAGLTSWQQERRRLSTRFTYEEVKLLLEEVKRNRILLDTRYLNGVHLNVKQKKWESITEKINQISQSPRSVTSVMKKWWDLKYDGRRRLAAIRGPDGPRILQSLTSVETLVHQILMPQEECDGWDVNPGTSPSYGSSAADKIKDRMSRRWIPFPADRNGDSQPTKFYPAPEPPMEDTPGTQSLRTYSRTSSSTSASYPGPHSSPAFAAPPPYPAFSPSSFPTLSSSLSSSIAPPSLASPSSLPPPYPLPASSSLPPPYPLPPSSSLPPPYPALVPSTLPAPSSLSVPSSPPPPPSPAQRGGALQEQLVQCVSWSLAEQRASRVALGAVGRSLSSLAQSVQDVVESQQDFVHDSLRLQREMVDMLRDFSADALTLLRDKVNGRLPP